MTAALCILVLVTGEFSHMFFFLCVCVCVCLLHYISSHDCCLNPAIICMECCVHLVLLEP